MLHNEIESVEFSMCWGFREINGDIHESCLVGYLVVSFREEVIEWKIILFDFSQSFVYSEFKISSNAFPSDSERLKYFLTTFSVLSSNFELSNKVVMTLNITPSIISIFFTIIDNFKNILPN